MNAVNLVKGRQVLTFFFFIFEISTINEKKKEKVVKEFEKQSCLITVLFNKIIIIANKFK